MGWLATIFVLHCFRECLQLVSVKFNVKTCLGTLLNFFSILCWWQDLASAKPYILSQLVLSLSLSLRSSVASQSFLILFAVGYLLVIFYCLLFFLAGRKNFANIFSCWHITFLEDNNFSVNVRIYLQVEVFVSKTQRNKLKPLKIKELFF